MMHYGKYIFVLTFFFSSFIAGQNFKFTIQSGHSATVTQLAFSPTSSLLASAGTDKKCIVWDLKAYKQMQSFLLDAEAQYLYFLNTDSLLVVITKTELAVYDIANGKKLNSGYFKQLADLNNSFLNNEGKIVLVSSSVCRIIDPLTFSSLSEISFPENFSSASGAGKKVFVSNSYFNFGYTQDWPAASGSFNPPSITASQKKRLNKLDAHSSFSLNEKYNLVYYFSGANLQAHKTGELVSSRKLFKHFTIYASSLPELFSTYTAGADHLIIADRQGVIYMYNASTGRLSKTLKHHKERVNALTISSDQRFFASASTKEIVLWDIETSKPIQWLRSNSTEISSINLSRDKNSLVTGSADGQLKIWNLNTNEMTEALVDIPGNRSKFSSYISKVEFVNDTLVKALVNYGIRYGEYLTRATEYEGLWNVRTNHVELKPVKQYSMTETGPAINSVLKGKTSETNLGIDVSYEGRELIIRRNGTEIKIENAHQENITSAVIDAKNKLLYSASEDGAIKIWNLNTGEQLVTSLSFGNDFLFVSPDNYYFSSKGAVKNVGYKKGLKIYPFEQLDVIYNRPEKVIKHLPFYSDQQKQLYANAYLKRLKWLGLNEADINADFSKVPEIKILSPAEKVTSSKEYKIVFKTWDSISPLSSVDVLINGVSFVRKKFTGKQMILDSVDLLLGPGKNFIQLFSTNSKGLSSLREGFFIEQISSKKQTLYLLTIGSGTFTQSNFDLKYASKDAKDFSSAFKKAGSFARTVSVTLNGKESGKENILKELRKLKDAKIEDEVVVFYAGHGLLDANLNYYLSTAEVDFADPAKAGLSYDTLIAILDAVPARSKLLFIDACHSGELDKDDVVKSNSNNTGNEKLVFRSVSGGVASKENAVGLKNSLEASKILFADLRQNNSVSVISSAGGAEYAIEGEKWNNGVFTFCLLQGLKKKNSDLNHDGKIYLDELQNYLIKEVRRISNGLQVPTSRSENIYNNILIR